MTAVADLTGADLALWAGRAARADFGPECNQGEYIMIGGHGGIPPEVYAPHEDWAQGGPLIDKLPRIRIQENADGFAVQCFTDPTMALPIYGYGPTILIAAMRALVASVYGDTVPDEVAP